MKTNRKMLVQNIHIKYGYKEDEAESAEKHNMSAPYLNM